MASKSTLNIAF